MDNRRRTMEKPMDRRTAHRLSHSPAARPVTHKLHSCGYEYIQSGFDRVK